MAPFLPKESRKTRPCYVRWKYLLLNRFIGLLLRLSFSSPVERKDAAKGQSSLWRRILKETLLFLAFSLFSLRHGHLFAIHSALRNLDPRNALQPEGDRHWRTGSKLHTFNNGNYTVDSTRTPRTLVLLSHSTPPSDLVPSRLPRASHGGSFTLWLRGHRCLCLDRSFYDLRSIRCLPPHLLLLLFP